MARYSYIPNRVIDSDGISDGASIYFYQIGTTTPVSIFTDAALTVAATNPYVVAAGAAVPPLYYAESDVRVKVVDSSGATVSDDDPYEDARPGFPSRTGIKALSVYDGRQVYLTEAGREGNFVYRLGDYSAQVTADTQEGIYLAADDVATTVGAWVRQFDGNLYAEWFGFATSETAANNNTYLQAAIDFAKQQTETILSDKYVVTTSDVLIGPGEFNLSDQVEIYTGVRLIGSGQSNTMIIHSGGATHCFFYSASGSEYLYNVWVMDMTIKGAGKTASDTLSAIKADRSTDGLAIYGCGVARCLITNCYDGINLQNCWTFEVTDTEMYDVGRNFVRGLNITAAKFRSNRLDVAGEDGLYITFSTTASLETIALHLEQNVIQSCQRRAIYGYDADHVMWDHNYVENCNQAGGYPHVEFASNSGTNAEMYSFVGGWASPSSNSGQPAFKIAKARMVSSHGVYIRGNNFSLGWELGADVEGYAIDGDFNGGTFISVNGDTTGTAVHRLGLTLHGVDSETHTTSQTSSNVNSSPSVRTRELNCTAGNRTFTLLDADLQYGRRYTVQKVDGGANLLVIAPSGTTKINGAAASVNSAAAYARAEIICGYEAGTTTPCWYVKFS